MNIFLIEVEKWTEEKNQLIQTGEKNTAKVEPMAQNKAI